LAVERREDVPVRWTTVVMAGLATVALEQAVLAPGHSRAAALAWTIGLLIAPALVASSYLAKRKDPGRPRTNQATVIALLALFALPFAGEAARLVLAGRGAMAEVTLLSALRNLGLGLAGMAYRLAYARLSVLVSLFLVTVASPVGGEAGIAVLAPVGGFAVAGTLWLMLVYWKRLGPLEHAGLASQRLPFSGAAWVLAVVGVFATVAAVGPSRAATALAGLVPTSGGTDWNEPDARSGVGDGDNEVSASEHPESVGFTQSDVYLETDRPSLYDAFNESYGEPFKRKTVEKMIALGQQDVGEQKQRPSENLQAGHEFSAVRRKPEPRARRPGERGARALVYVKGPTPLHLPLTTYSHFDGTTWHEEHCCDRHLPVELEPSSAWLRMLWVPAPFLAGIVTHQVKIGTLESSPIPMPPHPLRFRVGSVNRLDFFGWAQLGIIRMTDRTVPAGTVIDIESFTVDPAGLRSIAFPARPGDDVDHHLSFEGTYSIDPAVAALARDWAAESPEGWRQVEAVIAALRQGHVHDRSTTLPPDCHDVIAEFLLQTRRGPDYLFASSAAVLLRSLGYPTRVVSGLYAAPSRYDPRTRHTPVTGDDVHFWAEVRLPSGRWIAIEPTPGYELMPPVRPWSERIARALSVAAKWAINHTAGLLAAAVVLAGLVLRRRDVLDRLATVAIAFAPGCGSRRRVMQCLKLIERRARWAGHPRPTGLTLSRWYLPVAGRAAGDAGLALACLVRLADWAVHAPEELGPSAPATEDDIRQTCRSAVRAWTLSQFRRTTSSPRKEMTPT
jgi:protein-glutamine gamma-glutamyltransferase